MFISYALLNIMLGKAMCLQRMEPPHAYDAARKLLDGCVLDVAGPTGWALAHMPRTGQVCNCTFCLLALLRTWMLAR